jgi:serine/threonine protein kinase
VLEKQIGTGAFGSVHLALEKKSKKRVVLKILRKSDIQEAGTEEQVKREVDLHCHLVHENIVRCYACFQDAQYVYLVLEHAVQGSLNQVLRHSGRKMQQEAPRIVKELCLALRYLHEKDIIHRDVKLENILLDRDGHVKLADLGWAVRSKKRRNTLCGTVEYYPPEVKAKRPYGNRVDVWCAGVVAHELLLGRVPDKKLSEEDARALDPVAADFLRSLLTSETQRPNIDDVLSHPWLA